MGGLKIRREDLVELVYWRDPKKSGIVFGTVLGILLSLTYFSLISVVAYLSLVLLTGTISFRIYKMFFRLSKKLQMVILLRKFWNWT
ncbi:hypothetical protein L9F63_026334 [Diploptera punctata]|uniref:Reticulon-like protein n=1 Tax=Diploptera punctata TaxID=6984 RepID=A0AAD8AJX1_DIPPU|nr:hypothetical protein L9F63_026334 [Diploptera punctata]